MNRMQEIEARVINKSGNSSGVGTGMRIPGMKIGTQISPGGPRYEDVIWLIEKVKKCKEFIRTATYEKKEDMFVGQKLIEEIDAGK